MRDHPRLPPWLVKPLSDPARTRRVRDTLSTFRLHTVCDEARCPNRAECFGAGTATFMILGDRCTRDCAFCAVEPGEPRPVDPTEPGRVAAAARALGLRFVVVTSVTRDDLPDGGAAHFARTVSELRRTLPEAGVEVLVPDLQGMGESVDTVLRSAPDVFGHNVETVARLYASARCGADYGRSLAVLARASASRLTPRVKSAIMLGLGETRAELEETLRDLRSCGVTVVCLGQYLRPTRAHLPVTRFVAPVEFEEIEALALGFGFQSVSSSPFVRSSYHAELTAAGAPGFARPPDVGA